ncbi:hypothetical protein, partial [Mesorhizobium sp. M7A.T.Ca.US.000.02.2.1]|uniref:hypothetical protein n=1 Tax=Mesorhizobium sp. M7A.T.Ca.US.000.02.2.1 TaxID=2496793 RepID=UPI001AECEECB
MNPRHATYKRSLISGASVVTIAAVTGLIGVWSSAYGQSQPAADQPSSLPSFVSMAAPLSSGFPAWPVAPCFGSGGGVCYNNAIAYSDREY